MELQTLNHGDTLECYGDEYEIVLILGMRVTLRNLKADKKGKHHVVETDVNVVLNQIQDGIYKLKKKETVNKNNY